MPSLLRPCSQDSNLRGLRLPVAVPKLFLFAHRRKLPSFMNMASMIGIKIPEGVKTWMQ